MEISNALSEKITRYYKRNWIPAYFYDLSEIKSSIHKISRNLPKQVMRDTKLRERINAIWNIKKHRKSR